MKKLLIDVLNNTEQYVDLTAEDIAEVERNKQDALARQQAKADADAQAEAEAQAKETAQASGNQKLLDLGLTQAEATALTGYTPPVAE